MKRLLVSFVVIVICVCPMFARDLIERPPATYPSPVPGFEQTGDMNFSYTLTPEDSQHAFWAALGTWFPYLAGDCNGDGNITAGDSSAIFYGIMNQSICAAPIPTPVIPLTPTPTPSMNDNQILVNGFSLIGCPDDQMIYSIYMMNPDYPVDSFGIEFHYDPDAISYVNCENGNLDPGWTMLDCAEKEPGIARAGGFAVDVSVPTGSSGNLINLIFNAECQNCYFGELKSYSFQWRVDDLEPFYTVDGVLEFSCVNSVHNGDANLDHQLTSGDAQLTFLYVLGQVSFSYQQMETADCNGNTDITSEDAQQIFMAALGMGTCEDPM